MIKELIKGQAIMENGEKIEREGRKWRKLKIKERNKKGMIKELIK